MTEFPLPPKIIEGQRIRMMARDKRQATELFLLVDNNREFLDRWLPWVKSTKCHFI